MYVSYLLTYQLRKLNKHDLCLRLCLHYAKLVGLAVNPLTSRSDLHVISPYSIHTLSSKQVVRLLKLIRLKI